MVVAEESGCVVRDRGGVTWLDTRLMEWEPMPALEGYYQKVLVRDENGDPSVTLNYVASTRAAPYHSATLPFRHRHKTVREFAFIVEGEFINWEWESPEQIEGDLMWKKRGFFLDRKPGSLHGREALEPTSATGAVFLNWREGGPGIWYGERNIDVETESVPFPATSSFSPTGDAPHEAGKGCIRNRGGSTWLDTREMQWEPMPGLPGYYEKVLVRDAEGEPSATLNYLPPRMVQPDAPMTLPYRHVHRTVREFCFVLEGEFATWEYESADRLEGDRVVKRAGYFMDRRPGSIHGLESAEQSSATGAVLLNWREGGSGIWFGEKGFEDETQAVPYR
jgi:hypothetical protein